VTAMLDAALGYAARGWPVFPCSPDTKAPLLPKESKPGAKDGGLYLASADERQIRAWWDRWPKAMIGLPTGKPSGTVVVDLDPKQFEANDMLMALGAWLGSELDARISRTQSGGYHLVFAAPEEKLGNRAGLFRRITDAPEEIREHVDVRADGGYIIVPPSVMTSGTFYEWLSPPDGPLPVLPGRLQDAISKRLDERPGAAAQPGASPSPAQPPHGDAVDEARRKWALAGLDRITRELAATGEGARGFELNKAGYVLGGYVGAGILDHSIAAAALFSACERNGLAGKDGARKCHDNIARSLTAGMASPADVTGIGAMAGASRSARGARAGALPPDDVPPPTEPPPGPSMRDQGGPASQPGGSGLGNHQEGCGDEMDMRCALFPLTDMGNAMRFVARFGEDFLYVEQWGWMAWDGKRWNGHEAEAMVQRAVHRTIMAIADEARILRLYDLIFTEATLDAKWTAHQAGEGWRFINPAIDKSNKKGIITFADKIQGWCLSSQGNAHITCMARLAQHYLTASPDSFDADPMAFNVENGTLRFAKRQDQDYVSFHRHDRRDRMTKIAPVAFDPEAQCPLYDKFLERVHPDADDAGNAAGGAEMRRHLHILGGVSLTAVQIPKMWFWYGVGRNGKSVLADVWAYVLGDYTQSIPIESFLDSGRARRGGEASPDIASLPGVRMLRTSEPEKRSKLAESMIKLVTGGEPLRARHLNRDFFEFKPSFKLIMQGNYKPSIEGTDEGIWARMMLVPWKVTIPEKERDPNLTAKLFAEGAGILNRLLDGVRDYLDNGLMSPDEVRQATQDYREDSDPVGRFITECLELMPGARTPGGELYQLYKAWAGANGEPKWSGKAFKRGMADHGIRALKSSSVFYLDVTPKLTVDHFKGQSFDEDKGSE
jgi:putative DNA primase/helicase